MPCGQRCRVGKSYLLVICSERSKATIGLPLSVSVTYSRSTFTPPHTHTPSPHQTKSPILFTFCTNRCIMEFLCVCVCCAWCGMESNKGIKPVYKPGVGLTGSCVNHYTTECVCVLCDGVTLTQTCRRWWFLNWDEECRRPPGRVSRSTEVGDSEACHLISAILLGSTGQKF